LKERKVIRLTRPMAVPEPRSSRAGDIACDEALFERLRQFRKRLADERNVPPYIIFSDVALRQMARDYPVNEKEFARISGVGEKKLAEFGALFLAEIAAHLQTNPRQIFADESFMSSGAIPARARLGDTARETLRLFSAGESIEGIAAKRGLTTGTIYSHLHDAAMAGEKLDLKRFFSPGELDEVAVAFQKVGFANLTGVFELLGARQDYGKLRIFRASMNQ
jgi:ATP-dependent DNA helicase RecQ